MPALKVGCEMIVVVEHRRMTMDGTDQSLDGPDYIGPVLLSAPDTWVLIETPTGWDIRFNYNGELLACWCDGDRKEG